MPAGTLTLAEAAEVLGVSERTAYDLARKNGRLAPGVPVFKIAGLWKVSKVQLEQFLADPTAVAS